MFRKSSFFQLYLSSTLQRRFMSNEQRFQFKNTNKKKIFAGKSKYALLVTFAPNFKIMQFSNFVTIHRLLR